MFYYTLCFNASTALKMLHYFAACMSYLSSVSIMAALQILVGLCHICVAMV